VSTRRQSFDTPAHAATADRLHAFVLLSLLSRDLTEVVRGALGRRSGGNRSIEVFFTVITRPGVTPTEIATAVGVDRSMASRALRRLETDRLVRRRADPLDGRRTRVEPTELGVSRVARFEAELSRHFRESAETYRTIGDVLSAVGGTGRPPPEVSDAPVATAIDAMGVLTRAGDLFLDDLAPVLPRLRLTKATDRAALAILVEREPVRPSEVGAALRLGSSGTASLVSRLVARGYALRHLDPEDGRAALLSSTERARDAVELLADTLARHADEISAALASAAAFGERRSTCPSRGAP
jgi:DNA-binding MarR family transcriptional regulator